MAYGRRKKGGQRLMEMSRAGAKRKAAQRERTAKNFGVGAKNTVQPKKKAAPAKAAPKKKVAATKSDAGKYMGPYSKRTTSAKKKTTAKRKSSGPAPLPKTMIGRESFMDAVKKRGPSAALTALSVVPAVRGARALGGLLGMGRKAMPKIKPDAASKVLRQQADRKTIDKAKRKYTGETTTPKPKDKRFQQLKKVEASQRSKQQKSVIPKKKAAKKKTAKK
jgi:hypothetical protein